MADQVLYGGFRRLSAFALDPSSIFETREKMLEYLKTNPIAYLGQQLTVYADSTPEYNGIYIVKEQTSEDKKENKVGRFAITDTPAEISKEVVSVIKKQKELKESQDSIKETVDSLKEVTDEFFSESSSSGSLNLKGINNKIKEIESLLEGDLTDPKSIFAELEGKISNLEVKIGDGYSELEKDIADKYLTKISAETRFASLMSLIKELEETLDLLDDDAINSSVERKIEQLRNTIAELDGKAETLKTTVSELQKSVGTLWLEFNGHILNLKDNFEIFLNESPIYNQDKTNINGQISSMRTTVISNSNDIEVLKTYNIPSIKENIRDASEQITDIKEKYSTKEYIENELNTFKNEINDYVKYTGVKRVISFNFSGSSSNIYHNLPKDSLITEARIVVENPSSGKRASLVLIDDNRHLLFDDSEFSLDESATYVFELSNIVRVTENSILLEAETDFGLATGVVYITYNELFS